MSLQETACALIRAEVNRIGQQAQVKALEAVACYLHTLAYGLRQRPWWAVWPIRRWWERRETRRWCAEVQTHFNAALLYQACATAALFDKEHLPCHTNASS